MSRPLEPLDPVHYRELVRRALAEDLGWGDYTTEATIPSDLRATGVLLAKSRCVLAGMEVALETFRQLDPAVSIHALRKDGDVCETGDRLAELTGFAAALLTAERTALNFLQHMSGVATATREYVDAVAGKITILDTRKTLPTLRVLEKYAVRAGGGTNHRSTLDEAMLIKDNHVRVAGGVAEALRRAREARHDIPIEIEAQSLEQLEQAIAAGATFILLDNLSTPEIREAVRRVAGRARLEISGGVTLSRIAELAGTGADFVSVGALTHSTRAADISFELGDFASDATG